MVFWGVGPKSFQSDLRHPINPQEPHQHNVMRPRARKTDRGDQLPRRQSPQSPKVHYRGGVSNNSVTAPRDSVARVTPREIQGGPELIHREREDCLTGHFTVTPALDPPSSVLEA